MLTFRMNSLSGPKTRSVPALERGLLILEYLVRGSHNEVRDIVGKLTVGFDVIDLEAYGHVVFGKGLHVGSRVFKERGKRQFQAVRAGLANNPVKDGTLDRQIAARIGTERARVAQPDVPFDARSAALTDGQCVDAFL